MMSSVSVVIAFYNHIDYLRLVFASFYRQTDDTFKVIIADDGSEKTVKKQVEKFARSASIPTKYLWKKAPGFRKNRILNQAIATA